MNRKEIKKISLQIRKIKAGDKKAFRLLIDDHKRLVSHIVYRMVNDRAFQEDICQDVFLKVYQNLEKFRFEAKLSTWIARITYNVCLNYLKKKKPSLFDDRQAGGKTIESVEGTQTSPDLYAESADLFFILNKEIKQLDLPYRTILTLYHLDEMSYSEIGEIMDIPAGTVKSYLFRARKRLKGILLKKYRKEEL